MKIVFDTNVIISALLWTGDSHQILKMAGKGEIVICTTPKIIEELEESFVNLVELYPNTYIYPVVKEDPSDDKFLACAKYTNASYIISGDKHLLKLKSYSGISIVEPSAFLKKITKIEV